MPDFVQISQFSPIVAVVAIFVWFLWQELKRKKNDNGDMAEKIITELKLTNENHLHTINESINNGTKEITKAIYELNSKISELCGLLKK